MDRLWDNRWFTSCAAVVAGIIAFILFLNVAVRVAPPVFLRTDLQLRSRSQGFYQLEKSKDLLFAWTQPHAEFTLPAIDRRVDWRINLELKVFRPPNVPMPVVRIGVDGVPAAEQLITGNTTLSATLPKRPGAYGMTVSIDTTPPFVPGPKDKRQLGIVVSSITLEPASDQPGVPLGTGANGAAAIAILAVTVAAIGAGPLWVGAFGTAVALGEAALIARGIGRYPPYPGHVFLLAGALGLGTFSVVRTIEWLRRRKMEAGAIAAIALTLGACFLKLMLLLHPDMPIGDGVFHAHRFEYVLAGRLYFTSLTPDNYAFPYPVFFYVVSAPFAWLASDTLERLTVLRIVSTIADATAATLLYWMIVRPTSDKLAGIAAVLWYHAMPMTAWIMTWGALTNAFAQTLFVASVALVVALPVESTRRGTVALLTIVVTAALLTHPSTCAILVALMATTSVLYAWRGGTLRAMSMGVGVATVSAAAIAMAVYYAWFPAVYASELSRIASASMASADEPSGPAGGGFSRALWFLDIYFGWPAIAAAAIGAWRLSRSAASAHLNLLLVAWAGISLGFLVLGVLTPIEMRYHFAAFPALAIAAGFACSWAWRAPVAVRLAMSALLIAGVWDGVAQWLWALTTYARLVR